MSQTYAAPPGSPRAHTSGPSSLPLIVLCLAQLMVLLDGTIVNIALPTLARELKLTAGGAQWVITSYYLAFGGLLLLGGRSGDLLGRRRVLLGGVGLFTLASLLGGLAGDETFLVTTRVLQGIGAATAAPSVLALIATTYPQPKARARALAVYAAMSSVGAATGLIAGGLLTEWLSWRWIFFVNLPLGAAVLLLAPRVLRETPAKKGRFDLAGALSATAGLTLLVHGLFRAGDEGWSDPWTLASFAAAAAALGAFLAVELRSDAPLLPLTMLTDRIRAGAFTMAFGAGAAMFVLFFFGSQFTQNVLHERPVVAGLQYVPFSATVMVTAQIVARLGARVPLGRLMAAGGVLATAALVWLSAIRPDSGYAGGLLGPLLLCATGMGLTLVPVTVTVISRVAPAESGVASGVLSTMQQIGGALGVAVAATMYGSQGFEGAFRTGAVIVVAATAAAALAIRPWQRTA